MAEAKKYVLYEDDIAIAFIPEKPCTMGHIHVEPKKVTKSVADLSDKEVEHLFYVASFSATALFENMGAQGTNIICNPGDHFTIDVVARSEGDTVNFIWTPKEANEEELKDAHKRIKDKADMIGVEQKKVEPTDVDKKETIETAEDGEEDERITQLRRIP